MIPNRLEALLSVAKGASRASWLLIGDLASSCYMESRATVRVQILVTNKEYGMNIQEECNELPDSASLEICTALEMGLDPKEVQHWCERSRCDLVNGNLVFILTAQDMFTIMLAEQGLAIHENPYDGHTLKETMKQVNRFDCKTQDVFVD